MTVTSLAQGGVFETAALIMLNGNPCPVVDRAGQTGMTGQPPDDDAALAGTLGNGGDTTQSPQSMIISPLQSIPGFCEQRGENDPANARQGCEDCCVMLLFQLPRFGLPVFLRRRSRQPGGQLVKPPVRLLDLTVEKAKARKEHGNVPDRSLGRSGMHRDSGLTQNLQHMGGAETADAMTLQKFGYGCLPDANRFDGRRHRLPQVQEPFGAKVTIEVQNSRTLFVAAIRQASRQ